ncbi:L-serine ammonia-lyase, iron-sulfur-dependent subunit beta [Papillibacter cinnamivorans]|uniref:L-serine deaminase n=1 Tax=Papillibacter cinnamivorans DSM 12816 TaxID=1122930 RepID=A0A1W2CVW8_9FIRM|nr:L-serine ammonia-lyase, iron-sulfur-dependent subunit beta [Papillibacter cinnamivorans]SMC88858.1 L-serine dehydratase [Papillibacter cinnamivorans DSM 12816]
MNLFDVVGPIMIGPSSSHTAGAVQLGRISRALLGEPPVFAVVRFYGSFARTGKGHGTDKAFVGGLLGMGMDDERLRNSLILAREAGLEVTFDPDREERPNRHPNSVTAVLTGASGRKVTVSGASIGGGSVIISRVDEYDVSFTGEYCVFIVLHRDTPGMVSRVTGELAKSGVNIAQMKVYRSDRGGHAIMLIETDQPVDPETARSVAGLHDVFGTMSADRV